MRIYLRPLTFAWTWSLIAVSLLSSAAMVQAQCPVNAAFTASTVYACQGSTVNFTNLTTGGAIFQGWFENGGVFASSLNASRTFNTPGQYTISLIATNGSCADTAQTIVIVDPDVAASTAVTNATCFGFSDGSVNLTPSGGVGNRSYDNIRSASDWSAINSVAGAGYTSGITVEGWIKPRSGWTTSDGMIVAFNTNTGANRFLFGYNATQQRFVYFDDNGGNRFASVTSPVGSWYHVALTINTSNQVQMYVNGTSVLTYTTTNAWIPQAGDLVSIGQEFDGIGVTSQYFDGNIDELRIWNAVLTGATVTANYNTCGPILSSHPNINNLIAYYSMNEGSGTFLFDRTGRNNHGTRVTGTTWAGPAATNYGCFSAGTGYAYNWSTGATTEDISLRPAGTYNYTVTDGAGCTQLGSAVVTAPPALVISVGAAPNDSVCAGDTTTLSATGALTYTWTPSATLSSGTGSAVNAFPGSSSATYQVIGTNISGCKDTVSITVGVVANPVAGISGLDLLCVGDTTELTATGGGTYAWSSGASGAVVELSPTTTTTYTVTVTNSFGCEDTAQYGVTVNALPVITFTGNDTICEGDSTTITAGGGDIYNWSTGATTAAAVLTATSTSYFSVAVIDTNGCRTSDSIQVVVNALPTVSFTGAAAVCEGDTANLTASGGTLYTWNTGATTATIDVSPTVTTTYTVTVTDGNSCENTDSVTLTVNTLPVVVATGGDTICFGDSVSLGASGANSYLWSNGATTANVTLFPSISETFTVMGTDTNGCVGMDSAAVVVNQPPALSISGPNQICNGTSAQFSATGGVSYQWSTGATTSTLTVAPGVGSHSYFVTVTDANTCSSSASIGLTVVPNPTATVTGNGPICFGGSTYLLADGATVYNWNNGASGDSIVVSPTSTTTYMVTVSDGNNCSDTASITVVVNPLPATPVITQLGGTMSTSTGFSAYQWYLGGNLITGATSNTYTPSPAVAGTYTVMVTNSNGCSSSSANFSFTPPVGMEDDLVSLGEAQVYPNPNQGSFSVLMTLDRGRELDFEVYDMVGHLLYNRHVKAGAGPLQQDVVLANAAKGVYFLHVRSGDDRIVKKVVVE